MMLFFVSKIAAYKGKYDSATSFKKGDIVLDQDASYICLQDNMGIPTSDSTFWALLASEASIIDDTELSSTTTTFSASNIVSQLNQKANVTHMHKMEDINGLQTAMDGKALTNHSHTLNDITDVDVATIPPVNDNVLTFESGKWVPKALSFGGGSITLENWYMDGEETVNLLDEVPPADVSGSNITYLSPTGLILNWTESKSSDTKDYTIYDGTTLLAVVPATSSKLQQLTYQVTGLTSGTNYTFVIKARDTSNNEAQGVSIAVKTYGTQALSMNGTSDYIKLPSMTFDTVELTCQTSLPANTARYYLDARSGVSTAYFQSTIYSTIQYGPVWSWKINNGDIQDINYAINNKMTLSLSLASAGTDDINIFSHYQLNAGSFMPGKIYSIRVLKGGVVVAYYDLTSQFTGTSITDMSGSGRTATLFGGTWATG